MVESVEQAHAAAALAAERGADLVEYRIDTFVEAGGDVPLLVRESPLSCILTCRPSWEGGEYEGDEGHRVGVYERSAAALPIYIDWELAANEKQADLRQRMHKIVHGPQRDQSVRPKLILSSHDFQTRPIDLVRRVQTMVDDKWCRIVKVAWRARSLRDNVEAFELLAERAKPMIALCMGEYGLASRVLAKKFGGFLTFVGLDDKAVTAPGQPGIDTIKSLYRWDAIGPRTAVYGVIGDPVGHSMSPAIMNAGFGEVAHDGVYLPMPIPPEYEHFKATVGTWLDYKPLDFRGASVTIPHKANLIRFVDERGGAVDPLARRIGAANTLVVAEDGSLTAANTDYAGAIDAVCDAMGVERAAMSGKRVAVLGAGGAARAIVAAFADLGATVTIYNRTLDRATELADAFGAAAAPLDALPSLEADVVVNCTPIGMHPNVDASPLDPWPAKLAADTVVFDTVYNPIRTKLVADAAERGCVTVAGIEMFVRQAAAQFTAWTAKPAPVDLFARIVRQRLGA